MGVGCLLWRGRMWIGYLGFCVGGGVVVGELCVDLGYCLVWLWFFVDGCVDFYCVGLYLDVLGLFLLLFVFCGWCMVGVCFGYFGMCGYFVLCVYEWGVGWNGVIVWLVDCLLYVVCVVVSDYWLDCVGWLLCYCVVG